jgi:uncharacterized protein YjbI with pentapeptide repeats
MKYAVDHEFKKGSGSFNWWGRVLQRDISSHQQWTASPEELARSVGDVARQARNVFVLHVSACTYAFVALLSVKDADFFSGLGGVKLPVLDIHAQPALFFIVVPLLLMTLAVYLNLYLGQLHRLQRRIAWIQRQGLTAIDPDTLYPWIGILAIQRSLYGAVMRLVFDAVVWWVAPCLVILYWVRLLPFRGLFIATLHGWGPPGARVVGFIAIVFLALVSTWSAARKFVDAVFKIGPAISIESYGLRALLVLSMSVLVGWQWPLQRYACRRNQFEFCRVNLRQATISTPPSNAVSNAQGAQMAMLKLDGAEIGGAYLDSANLSRSSITDADFFGASLRNAYMAYAYLDRASLPRAHLEGASLHFAHLPDAKLDYAHLENAGLQEAHLERASFVRAHLEGADLEQAQLRHSQLMEIHAQSTNFERANLVGSWLSGAHLQAANFVLAHLEGAGLTFAHLEGAAFDGSYLKGVRFDGSHLEGASFVGAHLEGASFVGAYINGANFAGSNVEVSQLPGPVGISICASPGFKSNGEVSTNSIECVRLQSETLKRVAAVSSEFRKIWENPPAWALWQTL